MASQSGIGVAANARSLGEKLGLNDWTERPYPVKGLVQDNAGASSAKCSVPFVRPDDVVKVSMSILIYSVQRQWRSIKGSCVFQIHRWARDF